MGPTPARLTLVSTLYRGAGTPPPAPPAGGAGFGASSPHAALILLTDRRRRRRPVLAGAPGVAGPPPYAAVLASLLGRRGLARGSTAGQAPRPHPYPASTVLALLTLRRRAVAPSALLAPTLLAAARLRLLAAVPALAAVYLNETPRRPAYPFAVMNPAASIPEVNNTADFWETQRVQFALMALSDAQADAMGRACLYALAPPPKLPPLAFADGYEMARWPGMSFLSGQTTPGPGGTRVWTFIFEVWFLVGRSPS